MKITVNKAENLLVYNHGETEPWGACEGVIADGGGEKINAICVRTLSLIPTCRSAKISDIEEADGKRIVLKKGCGIGGAVSDCAIKARQQIVKEGVDGERKHRARLNSLCFDTESGEITDVTVWGSPMSKKKKISINKIRVKENTIYVE